MHTFPWKALSALATGLVLGLGLFFLGSDYAGDTPTACRSCHTMEEAFTTWKSGPHHQQGCEACHLPQERLPRFLTKGVTGLRHATVFALGREGVHHRLADRSGMEANCRRCHPASPRLHPQSSRPCLECHGDTAHGAASLARR
ncbi:MAG: cytochrome c nitrate reductase, small subunit [Holophagaceae bacterium]|nr:cytochrome c nitrate reductase, small subunit [Holophagaceae bacterium]